MSKDKAKAPTGALVPPPTILVIGGGKMGGGLVRGWLQREVVPAASIRIAEPDATAASALMHHGVTVGAQAAELLEGVDVVVFAVKPGAIRKVAAELGKGLADKLAISVAAGVSLPALQQAAPARWVRVMPNQPSVIGAGAAGMVAADDVRAADRDIVQALFRAVGVAVWVADEAAMHAVTGLSGSGPAFVAVFAEAMEDAGVQAGLPRELARRLTLQTIAGAARQIVELHWQPTDLKNAVTSPGGTTIAGLAALEAGAFRAAVLDAVEAAVERSQELSES